MKKFFAILAIVALASCGGSETAAPAEDTTAAPVVIEDTTTAPAATEDTSAAGKDTSAVKPQ